MHCFYHQDKEAVGSCKSCGKGLCPDCAADVGKGLACRGRCEEDVRAVVALVDRSIKLSPQTTRLLESGRKLRSGGAMSGAIFNLITGAIFMAWGVTEMEQLRFLAILGGCFLAYGLFGLFQAWKLAKEQRLT